MIRSSTLSEILASTENKLRIFVDNILTLEFANWYENPLHLKPEVKNKLIIRQDEEENDLGISEKRLIEYATTMELKEIISSHSSVFDRVFPFPIDHYLNRINSSVRPSTF